MFEVGGCNLCPELIQFVDGFPVNKKPPLSDVFNTPKLMLQVVRMFPDINYKQRIKS